MGKADKQGENLKVASKRGKENRQRGRQNEAIQS